jgi:hypothetical protein
LITGRYEEQAGWTGQRGWGMMTVKESVMMVPIVVGLWRIISLDKKVKELAVALTQQTCHPSRKRLTMLGAGELETKIRKGYLPDKKEGG